MTHTMSAGDVPLVSMAKIPPAIQFEATKDFHSHTQQKDLDEAFLGNERRPWVRQKAHKDTRREREILNGLLSSTSVESDYASSCVDKLIAENISYRDLASLTDEDLKLFGFKSEKERQQLLEMFNKMPNQNPSYEYICTHPEAKTYNNEILGNASNHLMSLRASLAVTNYKLQVSTPEDVVVGDKRYASCFAQETLKSIKQITEEIAQDLRKIEANAQNARSQKKTQANESHKKKKWSLPTILYFTTLAVGFSCAWFWWWTKFRSAPRLERISVQT
ncbi:uncharacterized protein LOC122611764 isoform X1 [Drosophila teissieri]|uniref:uncharacterized protein LOC122611764 isoform X1 n=1 Tax=Drosophila teissieri TaxID=7243 RepID=UPI001CBA18E2|nr:uncharacterized protein LOC122611764 isoform X1 [Drosophila teissieri]